jgi:hypothetical protein
MDDKELGRTGREELIKIIKTFTSIHVKMTNAELISICKSLVTENLELNRQVKDVQEISSKLKVENQELKIPKKTAEELSTDHAIWSQLTFGADNKRGPNGPLKHLEKEVQEVIANQSDIEEYADCYLLIVDAARRAGFQFKELIGAADAKLQKNKKRVWPKVDESNLNEAVEHDRSKDELTQTAISAIRV